jgi:hypothetical protein
MIYNYALMMNKIFDSSWKCVLRSRRRLMLLEEMKMMNKSMNEKINAYKKISKNP